MPILAKTHFQSMSGDLYPLWHGVNQPYGEGIRPSLVKFVCRVVTDCLRHGTRGSSTVGLISEAKCIKIHSILYLWRLNQTSDDDDHKTKERKDKHLNGKLNFFLYFC